MAEYIPGVCNIGPEEIKKRRQGGIFGLIVSLLFIILVLFFKVNPLWRLLIFFPSFSAATGFLQAGMHFCAGFGFKGVYNVLKPAGQTETVQQQEFRKKDKQKALQIIYLSIFIGVIVSLVFYFI
jgi:hypothetical protein